MTFEGGAASPLALAALTLVEDRTTAAELERRAAELGADLRPGVAAGLLSQIAVLGLVRVARGTGEDAEYVPTSLGAQVIEGGVLGAGSAPLEELERLRTDLLSTIAHELRTPLTAIRTSASLLLDPSTDPSEEQRRAMIETIDRNAGRMQRLIEDILELARFRSGVVRLQARPFEATELARSVVNAIGPLAKERNQTVELVAPEADGARVFGDYRRLEQALLNLVSNAQRFAPEGGRVTVTVSTGRDVVAWSVTDDGPGIAPDELVRLFERFFVGRNDRTGPREGVGLGLPTALAIAQAHGGRIDVDTEVGRGSTFTLAVPVAGPADES